MTVMTFDALDTSKPITITESFAPNVFLQALHSFAGSFAADMIMHARGHETHPSRTLSKTADTGTFWQRVGSSAAEADTFWTEPEPQPGIIRRALNRVSLLRRRGG